MTKTMDSDYAKIDKDDKLIFITGVALCWLSKQNKLVENQNRTWKYVNTRPIPPPTVKWT